VALIKPQFEAGREKVGKKGVVRDPLVHQEVIAKVCKVLDDLNWAVRGVDFSPLKGPEGNIEYLVYFTREEQIPETSREELQGEILSVVEKAYLNL